MNRRQLVVFSERRGFWASQLRPRLWDRPAIWRETRGTSDLLDAVAGWPSPIVLLDLEAQPRGALDRLVSLAAVAPDALILALDPEDRPELRALARSLGASNVWSGFARPPDVADLIDRWLTLARVRAARSGRAALPEPGPDPDDPIALFGT